MPTPSMTVNTHTTVGQLHAFIQTNANGQTQKLRGKENKDGSYTLYLDKKSSSQFDRMTGAAAKRNNAGAAAVQLVFDRFKESGEDVGMGKSKGGAKLFGAIDQALSRTGSKAQEAGKISDTAGKANLIGTKLGLVLGPVKDPNAPTIPAAKPLSANAARARGPQIDVKFSTFQANEMSSALLTAGKHSDLIDTLAKNLSESLGRTNATPTERYELSLSNGNFVKEKMASAIKDQLTKHGASVPPDLEHLIDIAFEKVANQSLGTKASELKSVTIMKAGQPVQRDLPDLHINNKDYEPTRHLGNGGFGEVLLYKNKNDPTDTIAFKMTTIDANSPEPPEICGENIKEIMAHKTANTSGSDNVLRMEGAVRLGNGLLGIALEAAPKGDIMDFAKAIPAKISAGQLTPAQAKTVRLTTLQGMLKGLKAVSDQGLIHLDVKAPNCMLGSDGKVKVIDFGTTVQTPALSLKDVPKTIANVRFISPELSLGRKAVTKDAQSDRTQFQTDIASAVKTFMPISSDLAAELASLGINSDVNTANFKKALADQPVIGEKIGETEELATSDTPNSIDATEKKKQEAAIKKLETHNKNQITFTSQLAGLKKFDEMRMDTSTAQITSKADIWGAGIAAINLFTGQNLLNHYTFDSELEDHLTAYSTNPNSRAVGPAGNGPPTPPSLMRSTGDADIDDLINGLLNPDPTLRLSVDAALAHPAFQGAGIGSAATLTLIQNLV